ncbi:hypothetical protein KAU51_01165 [Candidatus Parcubacteria bacterium]|nr:hypothetical protein [Candidatus Parcubacteria bacterium]
MMTKKKIISLLGLDKPINKKWILSIILIILSPFILFGLLFGLLRIYDSVYLIYIDYLPVPEYQKRTEPINIWSLCEKIKDSQSQELCFTIVKEKDFEKCLDLVSEVKKYSSENYPWYDFPFYSSPRYNYFPGGVERMIREGKNYDSDWWCREIYFPYVYVEEDYYFCRAFLENPHFCSKILYSIGPSKKICYQDAAFVWEDPLLCQKAEYPDFCYLRIVLKYLETQEKKMIK